MPDLAYTSYDDTLARVEIDLATVRATIGVDDTGLVERSLDQVRWTTVRGGSAVSLTAAALPLSDFEFAPDVENFYRVTATSSNYTDSLTPSLDGQVWLKNVRFAFTNMPVTVIDVGQITRSARSGTFAVLNRNLPVAVSQARGGAAFTLTLDAADEAEGDAITEVTASGDVLLLQVPPGQDIPAGYYSAGDVTEQRTSGSTGRQFALPLTEVAAPGPDVVPVTVTWQTVIDRYATWQALVTDQATWADVLSLVGAPADVIVP
jgi:hypothetical protein